MMMKMMMRPARDPHKALNLPEAAGARSGVSGDGPALRLLVLGDSSAAGVGVETQSEALAGHLVDRLKPHFRVTWAVEAQTGAPTRSTLDDVANRPATACDVAVVALGVNDVTRFVSPGALKTRNTRLLEWLQIECGARLVYVSGIPPLGSFPLLPAPLRGVLGRHADRLDRMLRGAVPQRPGCRYVGFDMPLDPSLMARDGFHPGPELYRLWGVELADIILEDFERLPASCPEPVAL